MKVEIANVILSTSYYHKEENKYRIFHKSIFQLNAFLSLQKSHQNKII